MTQQKPGLSDPAVAAAAWHRYRRMMRWMALVAALATGVALAWLHRTGGLQSIHMILATIAGVFFTVLLAAALMLAVFMSSGSGHDESVSNGPEDDWQ